MKRVVKPIFVTSLLILLSACAGEEGYKVQIEPTLPVPILIVPDHGSSNTPNNNQTTYPNTNQNDTYQRDNQSQPSKDSRRTKRQRSNKNPNQPPAYNQPSYNNDAQQQNYQ